MNALFKPGNLDFYEDTDESVEQAVRDSYADEVFINEKYSLEERKILACDLLGSKEHKSRYFPVNLDKYGYWLSPGTCYIKGFYLMLEPLENMPLRINDEDFYTRIIALWRLKCAK